MIQDMSLDHAASEHPAVTAGEVAAFRDAVRRFVGARVRDDALADDLTQEIFVRVLQRLPQVKDPRRIMGWLFQIARNVVTDHFRQHRPNEPLTDQRSVDQDAGEAALDREALELHDRLASYIRSVVYNLPPAYREALIRTEYEGLSQVELARELGLSVSAAKSRVQRAREMVRATIEKCCHWEVDTYGTVVACEPRRQACGCKEPASQRES
jgi:RNA polymerase sigma-70 factor, ECF subfamily